MRLAPGGANDEAGSALGSHFCAGGSGTGLAPHALECAEGDAEYPPPDELERAVGWRPFAAQAAVWYERRRGTHPGWMQRLAVSAARSRPLPWCHLLELHLRQHMLGRGRDGFSWRRSQRRDPTGGALLLPGLAALRGGELGLLVDTSGSMSRKDLARVFGVVKQILLRLCAGGEVAVHFLACDVHAHYAGRICSDRQLAALELPRGCGADLRVGMALAARLPHWCLLVLADGYPPGRRRPPGFS